MTRPARPSRKAAFAEDEEKIRQAQDKMGDILETLAPRKGEPARLQSVPPLPDIAPGEPAAEPAASPRTVDRPVDMPEAQIEVGGEGLAQGSAPDRGDTAAQLQTAATVSAESGPDVVPAAGSGDRRERKSAKASAVSKQAEEGPKKPPAAWISSDVYSRLLEYSDQEKRTRRSAARPFGVIALDAIESHAAELASSWKGSGGDFPHPGKLFVRETNSRYRRHDLPPRAITLQGVGPENAKLLKRLKKQWGAGSVSDLVERALRLEFGMCGDRS